MSIFASRTQKTVPIPFDPPHTVTLQKLTGRQLAKASQVFVNDLIAGVQARGGAAVQKDIEQLFKKNADEVQAEIKKVQADPLNGYDKPTLIKYGVKAWSYDEPVEAGLADLDEEAEEFFATEVMRLTKPALFLTTQEDAHDAVKNASGAFTSH